MALNNQLKQINEKLIELLRDLLAVGNWEASLFLRTAHRKLQELEKQAAILSKQIEACDLAAKKKRESQEEEDCLPVYISIYQSDAFNLVKWENTLKNIREYSVNRPIYRSEDHVQEMLRSKQGSPKEGYVAVYIRQSDIIPAYTGKRVTDRWGHELLTLRDNSLSPSNIIEFVHQNRRYRFEGDKLLIKFDK